MHFTCGSCEEKLLLSQTSEKMKGFSLLLLWYDGYWDSSRPDWSMIFAFKISGLFKIWTFWKTRFGVGYNCYFVSFKFFDCADIIIKHIWKTANQKPSHKKDDTCLDGP